MKGSNVHAIPEIEDEGQKRKKLCYVLVICFLRFIVCSVLFIFSFAIISASFKLCLVLTYTLYFTETNLSRYALNTLIVVVGVFVRLFTGISKLYVDHFIPEHDVVKYLIIDAVFVQGEKYRIYLVNMLEFDLVNSIHIHGGIYEYYPSGTSTTLLMVNDVITLGQGDRGIIELSYPYPGKYMFHTHINEFADKGWMSFFNVVPSNGTSTAAPVANSTMSSSSPHGM